MNSNQKGKRGEREVAKLLQSYGYEARRGRQFSGSPGSPDVVSDFPHHIEVKRTESLSLYSAMEQARNDSGDKKPIVFHKRNGKEWLVVMYADDYLKEKKDVNIQR